MLNVISWTLTAGFLYGAYLLVAKLPVLTQVLWGL